VRWGTSAAADNPNVSGDYDGATAQSSYTVVRIVVFVWYTEQQHKYNGGGHFPEREPVPEALARLYGADFTGDGRADVVFFTFGDGLPLPYRRCGNRCRRSNQVKL